MPYYLYLKNTKNRFKILALQLQNAKIVKEGNKMSKNDFNWNIEKKQFLQDWPALDEEELDKTNRDKTEIAELIKKKYILTFDQAMAAVLETFTNAAIIPPLPDTENMDNIDKLRKIESDTPPLYPNKLYEEELPPNIQLENENL